jgi:hypothetical protein
MGESKGKEVYRIRNWQVYNESLRKRGSVKLWLTGEAWAAWQAVDKKKVVGEKQFPDAVILYCLLVKAQYRLKLRQTIGFLESIFSLMGLGNLVLPNFSTLCRRQKLLPVEVRERLSSGERLNVGIDSTGLKVYGEGEWKVRKHGASKRRTWRKMHICLDLDTQKIIKAELTGNEEADAPVGKNMLEGQTEQIKSFSGDGAYDDFSFRELLGDGITQIIPPPKNAVIKTGTEKEPAPEYIRQRNETIAFIKEHDLSAWKEAVGYHKRSLNEVVMYRYKTICGDRLSARVIENQITEVKVNCTLLNRFCDLGMPDSYKVA